MQRSIGQLQTVSNMTSAAHNSIHGNDAQLSFQSPYGTPGVAVPYDPFDDGPVEEEKDEVLFDIETSESDAEQWLTRKSVKNADYSILHNKENEGLLGEVKNKEASVEAAAEQWLTRGNRDLLLQWKRNEDALDDGNQPSHSIEARSSVSSPGKSSLREKLQHRLQKRQELRDRQKREEQSKRRIDHDESAETADTLNDIMGAWTDEMRPTSPMSDTGLSTPVDPHGAHNRMPANSEDASNVSLYRLSRTVRYGRRGELPQPTGRGNVIRLHVYDLLANDTIMQLPFGCEFPIGKCFQTMNNGLHALGTGAYHCGIEVNGIEYAYGANDLADTTGVFTCVPKHSPGYQHRTTIDFGSRVVRKKAWVNIQTELVNTKTGQGTKVSDVYEEVENYLDGHEVLQAMAPEYRGTDYDLLEKNCCTFVRDACLRLGVKEHEIPTWFMNLATAGAVTREAAQKTLSAFNPPPKRITTRPKGEPPHGIITDNGGFEVILEETSSDFIQVVKVIDTQAENDARRNPGESVGIRRTLSWTY